MIQSTGQKAGGFISRITAFAKSVLSPRATKFVEAGYVDSCMNITDKGVEALHVIAMTEWGDKLEAMADAEIESTKSVR